MTVRKSVAALSAYPISPVTRRDKLRLDLNENNFGCSPRVLQALANPDRWDVSAYPEYGELYKLLSSRSGLPANHILVTNGADDGIRCLMQVFIEDGDSVVLTDPGFSIFNIFAQAAGAQLVKIAYQPDLRFPFEGFLEAAKAAPKLIAVVRPDSPTGGLISRKQLISLLEAAADSVIVLDETYHHFLGESCVDLVSKYRNLIVLHSFSKAYALAGMRIGIIYTNPAFIQHFRKVNPPFSVNGLAVVAAEAALADDDYLHEVVKVVTSEKTRLIDEFAALGIAAINAPANFLLLNVGAESDDIHARLLAEKIIVKNLNKIPLLRGHFRVAVGPPEANDRFLAAMREIGKPGNR